MTEDKQDSPLPSSSKSMREPARLADSSAVNEEQAPRSALHRLTFFVDKHWAWFLGLMVVFGFLLRVTGVYDRFEYPLGVDAGHFFGPVLEMMKNWSLNPNNFYYGNLVHYILLAYFLLLKLFGFTITNDPAYWYANVLAVLVGSATVLVAGLAGKAFGSGLAEGNGSRSEGAKATGAKTGLLMAFLVAILPYHIYRSTFINGDVFGIFFTTISLWLVAKVCTAGVNTAGASTAANNSCRETKLFGLAGLFTGLAASAKYNYALFALVLGFVYLFKTDFAFFRGLRHGRLRVHKSILVCAACVIGAFVLTSPFAVANYQTVQGILSFNSQHFKDGSHFAQNSYADGSSFTLPYGNHSWLIIPLVYLPIGLGFGLFVLFVVSLLALVYSWKKHALTSQRVASPLVKAVLVFLAIMYLYLAPNQVFHVRYIFPFFILALLVIVAWLANASRVWKAVAVVLVLYNVVFAVSISASYLDHTKQDLDLWLRANVNQTAVVDGRTNPVVPENTLQLTDSGQVAQGVFKYIIKVDEIEQKKPDYLVISTDYRDGFLMDSSLDPSGKTNLFLRRLFGGSAGYAQVATFESSYFSSSWYGYLRGEWADTYKDESDESSYYVFKRKG